MKLKDKTYRKFVAFFEAMAEKHEEEFELAYSEIQRETGVASITLKKAIQVLEQDGIIAVSPGRNTRYGIFKYLAVAQESSSTTRPNANQLNEDVTMDQLQDQVKNMTNLMEQFRQRIRTQDMTISVLQDRVADLEDKVL